MQSFNEYCQPNSYQNIDPGAVAVHGITVQRMKTFQSQSDMLDKFIAYLKSFNVKFIISGFNVSFDRRFLSSMFSKNGKESEFFALFDLQLHDTFNRAQSVKKEIGSENIKLETLAKHYGIHIDAHDAISDILATIEVDRHIGKLLKEEEFTLEVEAEDITISSKFPPVVQLHLHSMYGMVESVPSVEEWADWCLESGTPGFSIVDHGFAASLYGVVGLSKSTDKSKKLKYPGITGIPGMGLYFSTDLTTQDLYPFNAWAVSNEGYFNLMKLASLGYDNVITIDGVSRPRLTKDQIDNYRSGVIFGTGDVYGKIGQCIEAGNEEAATNAFNAYLEYLGTDLLAEFIPVNIKVTFSSKKGFQPIKKNDLVIDGNLNKAYNLFLSRMVDKHNLKCVPVSGAHFINKSDKLIQDCISRNSYESGKCYSESYHVRSSDDLYVELKRQLGDWLTEDKFMGWIKNTYDVLEAAKSIDIKHKYYLPKIDIPEHIKQKTSDYDKQTYYLLIEKCMNHGRWKDDPVYVERFKKEIDVIMKNKALNFIPYFLLYEDICAFARSQGILQGIGRGSAGGSLISYYLKIIHINPIVKNLPFERFLSHARINAGSFPDIDCDFGDRTPIIKYLEQKYGLGFAQICTYSKMKTKNAIKDAMFALYGTNREEPNLKAVCELIPDSPQGVDEYDFLYGYTDKEDVYHPGVVEVVDEVANFFTMYPAVEEMVKRLIGVVRGVSRHASAYVISSLDLANNCVPIMKMHDKATDHMLNVTQFEASMCEGSGLVKADILGVTTIQAVSDCIALIKQNTGIDYLEEDDEGVAYVYRLPEDKFVYKDFYNKETDSSFQFNTNTVKAYLKQFAPTSRENLAELTAILRPGAMDAIFINDEISADDGVTAAQYYVDVRNGKRNLRYLHPDLAPYTTNAIYVYQEQIMLFLVDMVGYTLEEADQIRSAIAKKKHEVMMATFERVREAGFKRGWTPEQADAICQQIQAFARYSFNRSHSAAYAELGYITMYLKHHHKLEWWTSILNNEDKEDKIRHFMTLLGDLVTSPSIKTPSEEFRIIGDKIVAPLTVLKSVGGAAIKELVSKGPFESFDDYIKRTAHNKVHAGVFAAIIQGRAADCFMDPSLPYLDARKKLMDEYIAARKIKKKFEEKLYNLTPISVFLMEKEINRCFNKSLLTDSAIKGVVESSIEDLEYTGGKNVPFFKGIPGDKIPVAASIKAAQNLIKNNYEGEIGLVLLFDSSEHKKGVSKKSGKEWNMVKANLTDGFSMIESVWWDKRQALRWGKNSIVFVRGKISEGWGGKLNITVSAMERLKDDFCKSEEETLRA